MNRGFLKKAVVGLGVAASVIGTAPAFAVHATVSGAHVWTSIYDNPDYTRLHIRDTACDNDDVQGRYRRIGSETIYETTNGAGCGTTLVTGGGDVIGQMQACRVERFLPDVCSSWAYHRR